MATIVPIDKTITQTITRFTLDIIELILNTSARFRVLQYDADDKLITASNINIEGDEYINWSNNDEYVVKLIAQKLGFTIQI